MPRNNKPLTAAFKKFITGKAGAREQSLFWAWLWKLDIEEKKATPPLEPIREKIWEKLAAQTIHKKQAAIIPLWKRISVAVAVLAAVTAGTWVLVKNRPEKTIARHSLISNDGTAIRHVTLPDGTEVTLNIYSSLELAGDFNSTERRVILKGEGYFQVHKDSARPFIVQSQGIETRALGTAFNIEARDRETQVRVALTEGRVAITPSAGKAPSALLTPGQILYYDRATAKATTTHFTTSVTAWTHGGLAFNGLPLAEALDRIAQRYQVKIRYNKENLAGKTVTASFKKTTWQQVLTNILYPYDLKYHNNNGVISIQ